MSELREAPLSLCACLAPCTPAAVDLQHSRDEQHPAHEAFAEVHSLDSLPRRIPHWCTLGLWRS